MTPEPIQNKITNLSRVDFCIIDKLVVKLINAEF